MLRGNGRESGVRVPDAAWRVVLFVLHQTLRHSVIDLLRRGEPGWIRAGDATAARLEHAADGRTVGRVLAQHVPQVAGDLFDDCLGSLRPGVTPWRRVWTAIRLRRALASSRRMGSLRGAAQRVARRVRDALLQRRGIRAAGRARPASGGRSDRTLRG